MRAQSWRVGLQGREALASSAPISSSDNPIRWAKTMNAILRSAAGIAAAGAGVSS